MTSFLDNLFSKIVAGEIPSNKIYEDDLTYAFLDINPLSLGHCLVIPKTKYITFGDVPPSVATALGRSVNLVAKAVVKATGCADYNILQNNGKPAHQEVPHCHFHIIPKQEDGAGLGVTWNAGKNTEPEDIQQKIIQAITEIQAASGAGAGAASEHRLPQTIQPRNYNLRLSPDLEKFTFDGQVFIECDVLEPTSVVVMHAKELAINHASDVTCLDMEGKTATALDVSFDQKKEQLTLTFGTPLARGAMTLSIAFTGILNDKMAGFYRSTYKGADGTEKVMATTQFEATDARRAFPCWDEPDFKATFDMTMVVQDKSLTSLSNMPIKRTTDLGEQGVEYVYFRSPVMSTYLLAFIIGELESIQGRTASGTEVNVYCTPGKESQCAFALDTACKVLDFFTDYMGISYPLPKCDMVGIPDFASGAMENWGLITYRETALFATDDSSAAAKQRVAYVVAHELAHQWFGNLVTMEWWSDLWLNEGFATWAGTLAVDYVFPKWDTWTQFSQDDGSYALSTDALLSSHSIQVVIDDPAMIDQVFDALSYSKGACMIRMLESHVGPDVFRRGLRNYLEKHQYKNTVTSDLWASISETAGYDVADMMDTWCKHVGFPVINVYGTATSELEITQQRFVDVGAKIPSPKHLWKVPLSALTSKGDSNGRNGQPLKFVLETESNKTAAPGGAWMKLNQGQTSFVRVNYDAEGWAVSCCVVIFREIFFLFGIWFSFLTRCFSFFFSFSLSFLLFSFVSSLPKQALVAPIRDQILPAVDRLGIANDVFALASAGLGSTTTALEMALAFKDNERDYSVWSAVAGGVGQISAIVEGSSFYPKFEAFAKELYAPLFEHLGWDPKETDSHTTSMLRAMSLSAVTKYGSKNVVEQALVRFAKYVETKELAPDLRTVVFNCAVEFGTVVQFEQMLRIWESAETPELKQKAMCAMGRTRDPELIERYLDFAFSGQVRPGDVLYVFVTLAGNAYAREQMWTFVKENWESKILTMYKGSHSMLAYMVALPLRGFSSREKADEGEAFFKEHPVPEATMKLSQVLEKIRSKANWLERDGKEMENFFAKY